MLCARRSESPVMARRLPEEDHWRDDGSCSYCGSVSPETLFRVIDEGGVLTPTDKNYKVYVRGSGLKQSYRDCPEDAECTGPDDCPHWVTRDVTESKFYFQHLDVDQRKRFIELLNAKKIKLDAPGYFYNLPFFIKREPTKEIPA